MTIPLLDYREGLLAIDVDVADKTERFLFDTIPMVHEPRAPFAADVLVKDIIYDGALGTAYMGHWRWTIDLRTSGGIWVTPSQPK